MLLATGSKEVYLYMISYNFSVALSEHDMVT